MRGLLEGLVIGSMGVGVLLLVARRHDRRLAMAKTISLVLASLSMFLMLKVDSAPVVSVTWIPGVGAIGLDLGPPGVYLAIGVFCSLALTLRLGEPSTSSAPAPRARAPLSAVASHWPGLAFLFCGVVVAALTLNHFLARYVILELVALCAVLTFLLKPPLVRDSFPLWRRYLCFRLGDAGLMLTILILWRFAGTFDIVTMLTRGLLLPLRQQVLISLGGLLTVWIKLGLPPFHGWLLDSSALSWEEQTWLAGIALPVLGAYLLYRLNPWLVALGALRILVLLAGVAILLWLSLTGLRGRLSGASSHWLIGHGAVGLMLVGTPVLDTYLLMFIPVRLGICLLARHRKRGGATAVSQERVAQFDPYGWLVPLANWAERLERRGLEAINGGVATAVLNLSRLSALVVEGEILEGINRRVARLAWRAGKTLQKMHTGRLRRNLLWASLSLVVLVVVALTQTL